METKFIYAFEFHTDEALCEYLKDLFEVENIEDIDILELFEGDPDMIKIDGYLSPFIDIVIDGIRYVLFTDEDAKCALEKFYSDKLERVEYNKNSWDYFDSQKNVLAYRGGKGYNYVLYNF